MKSEAFDTLALEEIFKFDLLIDLRLASRENGQLEFKESFHINSAHEYAKTMAAFANASGGYLVFGVKDKPRNLMGLTNNAFDNLDPAKLTEQLNSALSPELHWEQTIHTVKGKKVGIIYVHEAKTKPVVCSKNAGDLREGEIYYRYRGRSEKIKYPELRQILEAEREQERQLWMTMLQKMARMGIENVGVLNAATGEISGASGSLLISEELLPKLKFITSGRFVEAEGAPALKLVGEVTPIKANLIQPTRIVHHSLHGADLIRAFLRRETVLSPLQYVKQVCFEASKHFPLYFFINQTNVAVAEVIAEIDKVECQESKKTPLIQRLKKKESFAMGKLTTNSDVGKRRKEAFNHLLDKTYTDADAEADPVTFFHVLTHLTREQADPAFILPILLRTAMPKYQSSFSSLNASLMRKAICHLDLIWYKK